MKLFKDVNGKRFTSRDYEKRQLETYYRLKEDTADILEHMTGKKPTDKEVEAHVKKILDNPNVKLQDYTDVYFND